MARRNTEYGPGVDMWSAGVVLFILLGGGCIPILMRMPQQAEGNVSARSRV